jgi:hypothetical protein
MMMMMHLDEQWIMPQALMLTGILSTARALATHDA